MSNIVKQDRIAYQIDTLVIETKKADNAPVTRATWSATGLPDGLSISDTGVISGKPTESGTFECTVKVETNWGKATKAITITVEAE